VAWRRERTPLAEVITAASESPPVRDFASALTAGDGLSLIAEIKRCSPSAGVLCESFDPAAIAREYAGAGAAAISCLTDEIFFMGQLDHIKQIADACPLPVLRKDFIIDVYQVYESRAAQADAVLLIASVLPTDRMRELHELAISLGMTALVEVHNETEAKSALDAGAWIIGVNNRNLHDLSVDIETTIRLRSVIPNDAILVSESGIRTAEDVRRLRDAGVAAILVGEHLMRADDRRGAIRKLLGTA